MGNTFSYSPWPVLIEVFLVSSILPVLQLDYNCEYTTQIELAHCLDAREVLVCSVCYLGRHLHLGFVSSSFALVSSLIHW